MASHSVKSIERLGGMEGRNCSTAISDDLNVIIVFVLRLPTPPQIYEVSVINYTTLGKAT